MSEPFNILKKLINFIEKNNISDEMATDEEGYIDTWRSTEFNNLINRAKETIKKGDET